MPPLRFDPKARGEWAQSAVAGWAKGKQVSPGGGTLTLPSTTAARRCQVRPPGSMRPSTPKPERLWKARIALTVPDERGGRPMAPSTPPGSSSGRPSSWAAWVSSCWTTVTSGARFLAPFSHAPTDAVISMMGSPGFGHQQRRTASPLLFSIVADGSFLMHGLACHAGPVGRTSVRQPHVNPAVMSD